MAPSQAQRNRKLAARAAKRKAQVASKKTADRLASSTGGQIAAAARGPVVLCRRTAGMDEAGIGHVILARQMPSGLLGCAFFLVDLLCLGVKDAYFRQLTRSDLDEYLTTLASDGQGAMDIDPAFACKIVTGSVAYAARLGLPAPKAYPTLVKIFGDIDPASSQETVTFGRGGEPFYIPGPHESLTDERRIIATLTRTCGPHGFDIGLPDARYAELARALASGSPEDADDDDPVVDHGDGHEPESGADPSP